MSKNGLALTLTLFLIALIVLTAPSSSLTLFLSGLSGSYTKGSSIDFSIEANISSSEHIPINFIQLNITGNSSHSCKIYMNSTVEGCYFLTVKHIEYDSYGYGYGYGYDYGSHYLGYGYGYGPSKIRINLSLDTLALEGSYTAKAVIKAGYGSNVWEFSSPSYSFSVFFQQSQQPTTGKGGSKYFFEILGITKIDNRNYGVKVRNIGTEELAIHLEVENYTYPSIIIKPGEEAQLNYTFDDSKHRVFVVGESEGKRIVKYIDFGSNEQNQEQAKPTSSEASNVQQENQPSQNQAAKESEKTPTTGLVVGIEFLSKYKLAIILGLLLIVAAFIFFKLK
jgi:hypothetical protein